MKKSLLKSLLIIFSFLALLYFPYKLIKINEIKCSSQNDVCNSLIVQKLEKIKGESLNTAKKRIKETLRNDFIVKDFRLYFRLPDKIWVEIIERKASFALGDLEGKKSLLVAKDGNVISSGDSFGLPSLSTSEKLPGIGEKVDEKTLFASKILIAISNNFSIKRAERRKDLLLIELVNSTKVIFPLEGDKDLILGSFFLIESKLNKEDFNTRINVDEPLIIDLRYKNPVLRLGADI